MNWFLVFGAFFLLMFLPMRVLAMVAFFLLIAAVLDPDVTQTWLGVVYNKITNGALT